MSAGKRKRVELLRILGALANQRTTRAALLPILIRRGLDSMLPMLEQQVHAELEVQYRMRTILHYYEEGLLRRPQDNPSPGGCDPRAIAACVG